MPAYTLEDARRWAAQEAATGHAPNECPDCCIGGWKPWYAHIQGGVCFTCNGTNKGFGKMPSAYLVPVLAPPPLTGLEAALIGLDPLVVAGCTYEPSPTPVVEPPDGYDDPRQPCGNCDSSPCQHYRSCDEDDEPITWEYAEARALYFESLLHAS